MVLQLCGRVCRRLSLWNPNLKRLGFFLFIGTTRSPNGSIGLCFGSFDTVETVFFLARSANALENPVSTKQDFISGMDFF